MWKLQEYRTQFMRDLLIGEFPKKAESMFKKDGGGKYKLFDVIPAFYAMGDFKDSSIAKTVLDRIKSVRTSRIKTMIFKNIPKTARFQTRNEELNLICEYAKIRLQLLKRTLSNLA